MPDALGRFLPGEHWREPKPFWCRDWLAHEYEARQRSAEDIATEFGLRPTAILYWLGKHGIPRRSMSETRGIKHWGLAGSQNGMYGKRGAEVPSWKGGVTPERQAFYSTLEWQAAAAEVLVRDQHACRRCGQPRPMGSTRRRWHIHHIVPFRVKALRAEVSNLVLLCSRCHGFVHSRANVAGEFVGKEGSNGR